MSQPAKSNGTSLTTTKYPRVMKAKKPKNNANNLAITPSQSYLMSGPPNCRTSAERLGFPCILPSFIPTTPIAAAKFSDFFLPRYTNIDEYLHKNIQPIQSSGDIKGDDAPQNIIMTTSLDEILKKEIDSLFLNQEIMCNEEFFIDSIQENWQI